MSKITIHASMSIQNIGTSTGAASGGLFSRYDALNNKNNKLMKDSSVPIELRLRQQNKLMEEMNDICKKIEDSSQKSKSHKKSEYYHDKKELLNNTMTSEEAAKLIDLEKITEMAAKIDEAQELSNSGLDEAVSEDMKEYAEENTADIKAENESVSDTPVNAAINESVFHMDEEDPHHYDKKGQYIDQLL